MKIREIDEERQPVESLKMVDLSEITWPMIVIYEKPVDFSNEFVGRIWGIKGGDPVAYNTFILKNDLESMREDIVAAGFTICFDRAEGDDPVIRETWMR